MNENQEDIDLNNDVVNETDTAIDNVSVELEELRAYKAEQEEVKAQADRNREAAKRRVSQKQSTNPTSSIDKDLQEIKFLHKVATFSEEHGLSKLQAEKVLKLYPDASAETLKDPFIAEGIKALARKERVDESMPKTSRPSTIGGKSFSEMEPTEREKNFVKYYGLDK